MALDHFPEYRPSLIFRNEHLNTMYPHFLRKVLRIEFERERLELSDGDFIDLDLHEKDRNHLVVLLHGLEGNSNSHYVKGMTRALDRANMDVLVMNFRGCSGTPNRKYASYHSGKTDDLEEVIQFAEKRFPNKSLSIVGFSLGGNISLKYAGENNLALKNRIQAVCGISVPTDLLESAEIMQKPSNYLYMQRFRRKLKKKAMLKVDDFPEQKNALLALQECSTFEGYDDLYTAPANGFESAQDYYAQNSSKQFLKDIKIPTLLISALDDPFFGPKCHPVQEVVENNQLTFLQTKHGGHVGFASWNIFKNLWHENQVVKFITLNQKTTV